MDQAARAPADLDTSITVNPANGFALPKLDERRVIGMGFPPFDDNGLSVPLIALGDLRQTNSRAGRLKDRGDLRQLSWHEEADSPE